MADAIARLTAALAGQYRIERELGQGGMAVVYLAHDLKHGRQVALKVLRSDLAAVMGSDRFLAEIRTTATLQHPRILPLFDSGVTGALGSAPGLPFYVMPYVAGESLRARLARERQLPVPDAIAIASQVASALDHAHRHGVVHRDIKPDNILLQDGEAVVADFGIALAVEAAAGARLTETGLAVGTAEYMSPEQAAGERGLDGRSDLYALGCVLYEMLTGEPPYSGATAQVITAKRMTLPVPSVRAVRDTVAPALDAALQKALAKSPADRFASGREFAAALGAQVNTPLPQPGTPTVRLRRWLVPVMVGLALVAGAGYLVLRGRGPRATALDQNLLAVAPFDVPSSGLEVWREGIVDLLSRTLDGAGSLRTVSPSLVLKGWAGRSDRASAGDLGRRTGAGIVATGSLTQLGVGRVRIRTTLLEVQTGEPMGEVEMEGAVDSLGVLADSLGLGMLRTLSRTRPVAAVRQASIASAPLGALKAYLVGEQAFRRGDYDSALVAYQAAVTLDSNFALALRRMGQALGWTPPTALRYDSLLPRRAVLLNHGLPARESLLLAADSASSAVTKEHPELLRVAGERYQEAVRRYPADPEVWYAMGEFQAHATNDLWAALDAFERALELDPDFGPAYEHLIGLDLKLGREDRALVHARVAAELRGQTRYSSSVRLVSRLLLVPESQRPQAVSSVFDTASAKVLFDVAMESFTHVADSNETAVQLFRMLATRRIRPGEAAPWVVDSAMRQRYVALALARRGHLREAVQGIAGDLANERPEFWWTVWQDYYAIYAALGAIPPAQVSDVFARGLEPNGRVEDGFRRRWQGAPWWASRGDTASLIAFQRRMHEAAIRDGGTVAGQRAHFLEGVARGYLALVRSDTARALEQFSALPDSIYRDLVLSSQVRMQEARLLAARGADASARAILDRYSVSAGLLAVLARYERARVAEHQGDTATARRDFQHVLAAWRHADPQFAPYVTNAKAGLARVTSAKPGI